MFRINAYQASVNTTFRLLQLLKVNVTASTVNTVLQSHPDYPSLLSISDSLKQWKVDCLCINVPNENLLQLPVPFITIANNKKDSGFITVHKNADGIVAYTNGKGKVNTLAIAEFETLWNNVVLLAEPGAHAGEMDYEASLKKERLHNIKTPLLLGLAILITLLASWQYGESAVQKTGYLLACFAAFAGSFVAALLLWYEVDQHNPLLQQICNGSSKINCGAVLGSKQSKLFGRISWGEVGFAYFGGSYLCLLFGGVGAFALLGILNIITLPYTGFSVYYQYKIVKQWCPLCLAVQAVLIAQFVINIAFGFVQLPTSINTVVNIGAALCFALPILAWLFIKPRLLAAGEAKRTKAQLNSFKFDGEIFGALLKKQKQVTVEPTGLGITIGNPGASQTIIKVCNPYCGPCAKAHPEIDALIENNPDIKAQILFTATTIPNDKKAIPIRHLLAIDDKYNNEKSKEALDSWYLAKEKDYAAFAAQYPMNGELAQQDEKINAMDMWCTQTGITFTPTIFINGYQMPRQYAIGDLKYFLQK